MPNEKSVWQPLPPKGDAPHHYQFTVHALNLDTLDLPADASADLAGSIVNMNAIASASFTDIYGR